MKPDTIACAFQGRVGKDLEVRTSQSGKQWCALSVAVGGSAGGYQPGAGGSPKAAHGATSGPGGGNASASDTDTPQWVRVAVFGERATELAASVHKGDTVYVEGRLKLSTWEKDGQTRHGLECIATLVQPLGLIGNRKPVRAKTKARNGEVPVRDAHAGHCSAPRGVDPQAPLTRGSARGSPPPSARISHDGAGVITRGTGAPFDDPIPF